MANEIQFLLYNMPEEKGKVQVIIKDDTIWCTQKAMAQLFGVGVPAISKHLKISLRKENFRWMQLFPKWKQLPQTTRITQQPFIRLMPLLQLATVSIR